MFSFILDSYGFAGRLADDNLTVQAGEGVHFSNGVLSPF